VDATSGSGDYPGRLVFSTTADSQSSPTERMRIDSSGRVGIGTTSPSVPLEVAGTIISGASGQAGNYTLKRSADGANMGQLESVAGTNDMSLGNGTSTGALIFKTAANTERARIDSSGRLLVGTSTSPSAGQGQYSKLVALGGAGTTYGNISFGSTAAATSISSGDNIALLCFTDNAGNNFARIDCAADAAPGSNDYPGRLVFSTTADGASSPTEAMRINSAGNILFPESASTNKGLFWQSGGFSANEFGFYQVGDGLMWRCFNTVQKLIAKVGPSGGVQLTNGATSWGAYVSESRLKDIVGDCDYDQAWSLVRDIELKRYFYKDQDDEFKAGVPYLGPMADWLEEQDPELVVYNEPDEDGPVRTFNQGLLDMKALAALSAALKRIETLEAEVAALKGA